MKHILFAMAIIFAYPSFGFAETVEEEGLIGVPKRVFLESEVIGSHVTPSDIPMFPNFAVLLRHRDYGLAHCYLWVKELKKAQLFKRTYSCARIRQC